MTWQRRGPVTHGETVNGRISAEYRSWLAMHARCRAPSFRCRGYKRRGITVCRRWSKFQPFLADMGRMPKVSGVRYTIERRDNARGYTPKNCYWATYKEQAQNKRTTRRVRYAGKTQSLALWAEETGLNYGTLKGRLNKGWPVERALTAPLFSTGQYAGRRR